MENKGEGHSIKQGLEEATSLVLAAERFYTFTVYDVHLQSMKKSFRLKHCYVHQLLFMLTVIRT